MILVDPFPDFEKSKRAYCRLGCISKDGKTRQSIAVTSTDNIKDHCIAKHDKEWQRFEACCNNKASCDEFLERITVLEQATMDRIAQMNRRTLKFFRKIDDGLDVRVRNELTCLIWSVVNNVPRIALNCPFFDAYVSSIGGTKTTNRHDLQSEYLPILDQYVVKTMQKRMIKARSCSVSSDGWKDRRNRNWIDLAIAWMFERSIDEWDIEVFDADLVPVTTSSTGNVLETLVRESVDDLVPLDCVIATSTNDGGGDERKAAFQLVKEGNDIWCVAHRIQLCIGDLLDGKKASAPAQCIPHRAVLKKCHDLVVLINGHRDIRQAFSELAKTKRDTGEGQNMYDTLVIDQDTRWDSDINMMDRILYFDPEIMELYTTPGLGIQAECILTRQEFDLVFCMVKFLEPIRSFTKFVQYRNKVTLAHVPGKIDKVVTDMTFERVAPQLIGRADRAVDEARTFSALLIASVKARFASTFTGGSVALAARMLLPGPALMIFQNFDVTPQILNEVRENLLDDFVELLSSDTTEEDKQDLRLSVNGALNMAVRKLVLLPADTDPLRWWPCQREQLGTLFPLVKMLLAVPATSADNERAFSSAGFTLDIRRSRLDIEVFRREHRVRRFFVGGTDAHSAQGRQLKLSRLSDFLDYYAAEIMNHVVV
jgi:hypothetical protein